VEERRGGGNTAGIREKLDKEKDRSVEHVMLEASRMDEAIRYSKRIIPSISFNTYMYSIANTKVFQLDVISTYLGFISRFYSLYRR
jgi:hypothetical protein